LVIPDITQLPGWFYFAFLFATGCCVGSFLNVVIYRLPLGRSLVTPGSACPSCGRHIWFYDNIPLLSWIMLGGKCRYCKKRISVRYFFIELLTGLMFIGFFAMFFYSDLRQGIPEFWQGGWLVYAVTVVMMAALIAASAIDFERQIIPLSICWFVTFFGFFASALAPSIIDPAAITQYVIFPTTDDIIIRKASTIATLSAGAGVGLLISLMLIWSGLLKRSYDIDEEKEVSVHAGHIDPETESQFNDRLEMLKEILFLLPIILGAIAALLMVKYDYRVGAWWHGVIQKPQVAGLLGSMWGYFIGAGIVWLMRIFGTLAFGREAMGLGDVHLMGAVGTITGSLIVVSAFFIAPFFGLAWALVQMFFKKTRQIPYGPFLSLGVLVGIIQHDRILAYLVSIFYPQI